MDQIIYAGSIHFALLGVGLAILMLLAGNIGALMALPLLMATGLIPEQAIPIALVITAALIIPGALEHIQSGNVDKKFTGLVLLGILSGAFISKYILNTFIHHSQIALFSLYVLLLVSNFIYRRKPFPILPRPNNPVRKQIVSFIDSLPGKTKFADSGINLCPVIPIVLGSIVSLIAGALGPVASMLLCPILVIFLEIPVFIAIGTVAVINVFSFVTLATASGMLVYPVILQILLWMFLGTSLAYTLISYIMRKRKLHPLPLTIVFLTVTSLNLL